MTYREYINRVSFEDVWGLLTKIYDEKDVKTSYELLLSSVSRLPEYKTDAKIILRKGSGGRIRIVGAPYTQEELIDREVVFENLEKPLSDTEVATHLLYWSSMYGFLTATQHSENFSDWLDDISSGPFYDSKGIVKYIFLDFDGVLNTEQYQAELAIAGKETKDKYGPLFDPRAVAQLKRLIDATGARIVISSSWRFIHDDDMLDAMWQERELPGEIEYILIPEKEKNEAISDMVLTKYTPYVILDDEQDFDDEHKQYLLQISPVTGLSKSDVDKAIVILNRITDEFVHQLLIDQNERRKAHWAYAEKENRSLDRKRLHFWSDTIINDSAIDWSWNLLILKKKLEYNIGYWKYVQRHVGWEEDVARMQLCCLLLEIAASDYTDVKNKYVNKGNYKRFFNRTMFDSEEFEEMHKEELRREKAYRLVWRFMENNMKKWWD